MRRTLPWLLLLLAGCPEITDQFPFALVEVVDDDDASAGDDDDDSGPADDDDATAIECDLTWIVESADEVSFDETIQPIFDLHCDPCHTVFGEADLSLVPGLSHGNIVNVPNSIPDNLPWGDQIRIVPSSPEQSYMLHKFLGCESADPVWGYFGAPMPPAIGEVIPLTEEKISLIWSWIVQGAQDN